MNFEILSCAVGGMDFDDMDFSVCHLVKMLRKNFWVILFVDSHLSCNVQKLDVGGADDEPHDDDDLADTADRDGG